MIPVRQRTTPKNNNNNNNSNNNDLSSLDGWGRRRPPVGLSSAAFLYGRTRDNNLSPPWTRDLRWQEGGHHHRLIASQGRIEREQGTPGIDPAQRSRRGRWLPLASSRILPTPRPTSPAQQAGTAPCWRPQMLYLDSFVRLGHAGQISSLSYRGPILVLEPSVCLDGLHFQGRTCFHQGGGRVCDVCVFVCGVKELDLRRKHNKSRWCRVSST